MPPKKQKKDEMITVTQDILDNVECGLETWIELLTAIPESQRRAYIKKYLYSRKSKEPEQLEFEREFEQKMLAKKAERQKAREKEKGLKNTAHKGEDKETAEIAEAEVVESESYLTPEDKCFESNYIARSSWRTRNVWVQRVAAILISKISAKDEDFKAHDIPISEIVGEGRAGSTYRQLREDIGKVLLSQVVLLYERDGSGDFTVCTVFKDRIKYFEKKDCIRVSLNPALKQYYLELKDNFTVYSLPEFLKIRGTYAQTLYRYLKSWESAETHTEPLDRLHLILDTTPSLRKTYTNLKIKVLEPAHETITTNTSLKYTYESVKQGRKVVAVRFKFKSKPQYHKAPPKSTKSS